MDAYQTIHGIRVVKEHEFEDVLFEFERSGQSTEGIDSCLSEPIALEALAYLAEVKRAKFSRRLGACTPGPRPSGERQQQWLTDGPGSQMQQPQEV